MTLDDPTPAETALRAMQPGGIFVTGGAGFIGSRLVCKLSGMGHVVIVFDNLHPQVHGAVAVPPNFPDNVIFVRGDVRDTTALRTTLATHRPSLVYHLAAETGTDQSYDEIARYCDVNIGGTAHLLQGVRELDGTVRRIVLASSRAVYGEGACRDPDGQIVVPPPRSPERLATGDLHTRDEWGRTLTPIPTAEDAPPSPASVYASTKLMQELLLKQGLAATNIESAVLRFQNVYGPGQSLTNPYTGVLSIFCSQIMRGATLNIFEDGEIVRDFVFVDDAVDALMAAGICPNPGLKPVNIGSGRSTSILDTAQLLLKLLDASPDSYRISGDFRPGDVRFSVADIARARAILRWQPKVQLEEGLRLLARWVRRELSAPDFVSAEEC